MEHQSIGFQSYGFHDMRRPKDPLRIVRINCYAGATWNMQVQLAAKKKNTIPINAHKYWAFYFKPPKNMFGTLTNFNFINFCQLIIQIYPSIAEVSISSLNQGNFGFIKLYTTIFTCIYIQKYMNACVHICIHIHIHMHTYMHTFFLRLYIHACMHACIHMCVSARAQTRKSLHTSYVYICVYVLNCLVVAGSQ